MKQLSDDRGAFPLVMAIAVVVASLCTVLFLRQPVAKAADGLLENPLLTEMQKLTTTLISEDNAIRDLKEQLKAAGEGRLPARNLIAGDLDPNLYPAFRSLPSYRPKPAPAPKVSTASFPSKRDIASLHDQISGLQKALLSAESQSSRTQEEVQALRRNMDGHIVVSDERLAVIAARDERKYIYFDISKQKKPTQFGDIKLILKKADPKRNRFTFDLIANNRTITEKNRSILEPIQISLAKYTRPCELVVRDIKHDEIAGYLSVPSR
ncbi:MAG: hypothetical protein ACR2I2_15260 [Bryobacteraceae bacterium]